VRPLAQSPTRARRNGGGAGRPGNVLILRHGAIVCEKGYGEADRVRHTPYDASTVFDIGSFVADAYHGVHTIDDCGPKPVNARIRLREEGVAR